MGPGEWTAIGGFLFMVGSFTAGKAYGAGKSRQMLSDLVLVVNGLKDELPKIREGFSSCQRESIAARARVVEMIQAHESRRDIHTDGEWRKGMTDRIESIAASIGDRIGLLDQSVSQRLSMIEIAVKNGKG